MALVLIVVSGHLYSFVSIDSFVDIGDPDSDYTVSESACAEILDCDRPFLGYNAIAVGGHTYSNERKLVEYLRDSIAPFDLAGNARLLYQEGNEHLESAIASHNDDEYRQAAARYVDAARSVVSDIARQAMGGIVSSMRLAVDHKADRMAAAIFRWGDERVDYLMEVVEEADALAADAIRRGSRMMRSGVSDEDLKFSLDAIESLIAMYSHSYRLAVDAQNAYQIAGEVAAALQLNASHNARDREILLARYMALVIDQYGLAGFSRVNSRAARTSFDRAMEVMGLGDEQAAADYYRQSIEHYGIVINTAVERLVSAEEQNVRRAYHIADRAGAKKYDPTSYERANEYVSRAIKSRNRATSIAGQAIEAALSVKDERRDITDNELALALKVLDKIGSSYTDAFYFADKAKDRYRIARNTSREIAQDKHGKPSPAQLTRRLYESELAEYGMDIMRESGLDIYAPELFAEARDFFAQGNSAGDIDTAVEAYQEAIVRLAFAANEAINTIASQKRADVLHAMGYANSEGAPQKSARLYNLANGIVERALKNYDEVIAMALSARDEGLSFIGKPFTRQQSDYLAKAVSEIQEQYKQVFSLANQAEATYIKSGESAASLSGTQPTGQRGDDAMRAVQDALDALQRAEQMFDELQKRREQ